MVHNTRKKRHLQRKKNGKNRERRKLLTNCVQLSVHHAYRRTTERRATDLVKAKRRKWIKTKQNRNRKDTSWRRLWLINFRERTRTSTLSLSYYPLFGHPRQVRIHIIACRSPALAFPAATHFAVKRPVSCSSALRHSPSSWATVLHWLALILEVLRSSTRHPIHSLSCPPSQAALPISPPNIAQFGSLVSSMPATNPANRIHLLRVIASMLSVPIFTQVSR